MVNPSNLFEILLIQIIRLLHLPRLLALIVCFPINASAQVSITSDGFQYSQLFNSLNDTGNNNPWANNSTLPGWYAVSSKDTNGDEIPSDITTYRTSNSGTNAGLYSYGTSASDRALGSITTDLRGDIAFGVHFENSSMTTINSISISFRVEHWWRSSSTVIGHQRTKVSYAVSNSIDLTPAALLNNNTFTDVPEANLISIDTVTTDLALNGNSVFELISITIPVTIPAGSEFFLRFYDENLEGEDVGLAVDLLRVTFSSAIEPRISVTSGYSIFPYLDMGVVEDIPSRASSPPYIVPNPDQMDDWQFILDNFYDDDNLDDVDASAYDYVAVDFFDEFGRHYQVLRKQNYSGYYWGSFVKTVNSSSRLIIQASHPVDDIKTGTQGAAIYYMTEARGFMIAGTSRCASNEFSLCSGETNVCSDDDTNESFRKSDVAHEVNSIFQLATTTLASPNPSLVFVQLHGFEQDVDDPDLIISNGTINAQLKSVPDYPVMVRENLINDNPLLDIRITHVDSYPELGGQTNVQGRYLNLYPQNICTADNEPGAVTNRFLHIEQFLEYRQYQSHYLTVANALTQAINENGYERGILIDSDQFFGYSENFSNLYSLNTSHTWGNNLHVPGWYAAHANVADAYGAPDGLFSFYRLDNSPAAMGSGGLYAFGDQSDYSLGSLSTPSVTGNMAYGILLKNITGVTLYQMQLTYNSEQRRAVPNQTQSVQLAYTVSSQVDLSPDGILNGNFTNVPEGNMIAQDALASGSSQWLDDNEVIVTPYDITVPIVLNHDEEIFIRFFDNDVISESDEVMSLDDFFITFSSEPSLPVNWLYFNVLKKNGRPLLQWGADNENNCKNYDVLRSEDGKYFEFLTSIPCQRKPHANQYEYIDPSPMRPHNVYYKIAQYDEDGQSINSSVKSYLGDVIKPNIYYQNEELTINTDKEATLQSVTVMDFMGRIICNEKPSRESNSFYSLNCTLPKNQLVIIRMVFDSNTYVVHMRTGN